MTRSARLAALPLGYAGRTALGFGKKVGGKPAELVAAEVQQRTAEQVFKTLGELKGGAMKFGQAMSIFEVALPEEMLGPYRATLTKLQDAAPPMPVDTVHQCLLSFGHGGYDRGPMEQRLRDVLGFQIGDGTAQIMKTIIARTRAGREAVPA